MSLWPCYLFVWCCICRTRIVWALMMIMMMMMERWTSLCQKDSVLSILHQLHQISSQVRRDANQKQMELQKQRGKRKLVEEQAQARKRRREIHGHLLKRMRSVIWVIWMEVTLMMWWFQEIQQYQEEMLVSNYITASGILCLFICLFKE